MRAWVAMQEAMGAQRGHLFVWVPVLFGLGIGIYFALPWEPGLVGVCLGIIAAGGMSLLALRLPDAVAPLAVALVCVTAGLCTATLRTQMVAAPVLEGRYYGPVAGRIIALDRSAADLPRLTLDRVTLADRAPDATPVRVRVSLQGDVDILGLVPGQWVALTGHLLPPNGPVEPGDFDFRRLAWFDRLGAMGYTTTPVVLLAPPEPGAALWLAQLRRQMAAAVMARIPGDAGGYAAAVMTGDRSGLSAAATEGMRDSNLYHLVSISGMHMGMLVGIIFGFVRFVVALIPPLALRVSGKKIAAVVALPVAAFYLALAGRDVATERAFVMVAVMLVAILLDRRALTLRSVAMAALIVLALRPEALVNPGFQMSFAAVAALTAAYGALPAPGRWTGPARWLAPAGFLVLSSLVAGLATAPFAAAHFNRVAHYGLVANLLAVPVMGLIVMPGAVLMAVLSPLGLGRPAEMMVDIGSRWILAVSDWVAGWGGAVSAVPAPPPAVLPLLAMGGLIVILWQGRARWGGLVLPVVAVVLWVTAPRPDLLIAASGGLVGILGPEGRAVSRDQAEGFVAQNWLENDGDMTAQPDAAARWGAPVAVRTFRGQVGDLTVVQVAGDRALASLAGGCGGADILVSNVPVPGARPCQVIDPALLTDTGALAGQWRDGTLHLTAANGGTARPWAVAAPPLPPMMGPDVATNVAARAD